MTPQIPEGFKAELLRTLGAEESARLIAAIEETKPEIGVRFNPAKGGTRPTWMDNATPVEWCRNGFRLPQRPNFTLTPQWHSGQFYVQEPASMVTESIVAEIAGDTPLRVLDLCAAPGGKTSAALSALPPGSLMVANEYVAARASILKENLERWGNADVIVTNGATDFLADASSMFDIIIADVPCSGEGMMRKDPDAAAQWSPGLVAQCAALQRKILSDAVDALRDGGYIIYSTCTFNRDEDESNVEWLCSEHGFNTVELPWLAGMRSTLTSKHCYRFAPHTTNSEGLFVSLLCKETDGTRGTKIKARKQKSVDTKLIPWINTDSPSLGGNEQILFDHNSTLRMLSADYMPILSWLQERVRIVNAGVEVASAKAKGYVVEHGVLLSTVYRQGYFPEVELEENEALRYLARQNDPLPTETKKGFVAVTHAGLPLGWIKNLGNRYNNLYPANYRIRDTRSIE
jgi:16S rRNA C967 or C1407 C5-methylase (RsmB/RsmF family)/NOL1/NOP2/fmu family ribosome biogenesis protein